MKRCLFPIFLTALSLAFSSFAWGEEPRVEFSFRTYPEEIHWGDPFFAYFTACNKDDCPVRVVRQHNHGPDAGTLFFRDEVVYRWLVPARLNGLEGVFGHATTLYPPRFFLLKPQEERMVEFGMFWLPQPDHPADQEAEALRLRLGESGETFVFKTDIKWRSGYWDEKIRGRDIWKTLQKEDLLFKGKSNLTVKPRAETELSRLHQWYLEIPSMAKATLWSGDHVFAHCFHVRDSPYNVEASSRKEYREKRRPHETEMDEFVTRMRFRTPEVLERIRRTNELAAELLKLPDSEISRNMKKFVTLRAFLVDIRYAEDEEAEKAAFEALCRWLETTCDREFWLRFLDGIGFKAIYQHDEFPSEKVETYRQTLRDEFRDKNGK